MAYAISTTTWPATVQVDALVKNLIGTAFEALDDSGHEAVPRMAREFYMEKTRVVFPTESSMEEKVGLDLRCRCGET